MRKAVALFLLIAVATVGLTTAAAADVRVRGAHARVHRVAPPP
ncbi:MAG: TonB-dependent receptor, partial [Methylocystis sp.]